MPLPTVSTPSFPSDQINRVVGAEIVLPLNLDLESRLPLGKLSLKTSRRNGQINYPPSRSVMQTFCQGHQLLMGKFTLDIERVNLYPSLQSGLCLFWSLLEFVQNTLYLIHFDNCSSTAYSITFPYKHFQ